MALPDLTGITILMSDTHAAVQFRKSLTREAQRNGHTALLGPDIQILTNFIDSNQFRSSSNTVAKASRELILVEALREHPNLYGKSSPWLLAENLLQLFDELSQNQIALPDDIDHFTSQVREAYCIPGSITGEIEAQLSHESELVYTLWKAWQQQLNAENNIDHHQLYIEKLANYSHKTDQQLFLLGFTDFLPAEQQWFNKLATQGKATLIIQGDESYKDNPYHPSHAIKKIIEDNAQHLKNEHSPRNAYEEVIDDIYSPNSINILNRAKEISTRYPESPLQERISILPADNTEQEALSIELQIRQWLHIGKKNIAVVTHDRLLARRLRALLERTNIVLRDYSGWALSTTSAAAVLERWLECIEQDFNHLPLLDLLKSSFTFSPVEKEHVIYCAFRLEQDIILHENIAENIYRYKKQIERRARRIDEIWTEKLASDLHEILDRLDNAATPLKALKNGKHNPIKFLDALLQSMRDIDMFDGLANDIAGQRVLDEINSMHLSLSGREFSINWSEFRHWLGRTLERYSFVPPTQNSQVQLIDLNSSLLSKFDALIIAAADNEYLPGRPTQSAFFNDAVRHSLKLSTTEKYTTNLFYRYRCLLHSASEIVFSYTTDNNGNSNLASPWLECLRHYHETAWNNNLAPEMLIQWLGGKYSGHRNEDVETEPDVISGHAITMCDSQSLPTELSASGYQQLINCPYQFFASRCLNLKATEEIRIVLEKSDYGSRVHQCLQALHSDIEYLPGPFASAITSGNRMDAIECLNTISDKVFARDLEDNFQHRGWLQTWQRLIPMYIDWQINHNSMWEITGTEKILNNERAGGFNLKGVIDRTDISDDGLGIIDYKTGIPPSQQDILCGEAVQLPFYALLLSETISQVEYLMLNDGKVATKGRLQQDELAELVHAHTQRLDSLFNQLTSGSELPAWGDTKTCDYCDMDGICRRGAWEIVP